MEGSTVRSLIADRKSAIRAQEAFASVVGAAADVLVTHYERRWLLNRLLNDRGRFLIGLAILHLHFQGLRSEAAAGLTATRLKLLCSRHDICSPGRAAALLSTMRLAGLVKAVRTPDNRQKVLVPTHEFIRLHRMRLQRMFGIARPLMPPRHVERSMRHLEDDTYICALADAFMEAFASGFRILAPGHAMESLADRDGAMLIAFSLLLSAPSPASGEAAVSATVSDIAKRFCLSRSHVASVLREVELAGLIARNPSAGTIVLHPAFHEALADFFATVFALHAHCTASANAFMDAEQDRPRLRRKHP